jgi:hypothetical protein
MKMNLSPSLLGTIICILSATALGGIKVLPHAEIDKLSLNTLAKEGHGGQSVVCRDESRKITSAQLLDFFEAPIMYGQNILDSGESIENQINRVTTKLESAIYRPGAYSDIFKNINTIIRFTPDGVKLKPIDDSLVVTLPVGCNIEQLAVYVDKNLILIDREIWGKLSPTHQAGLIVHEGIYFDLRRFRETDSRRTRKIVGHLFSDFKFDFVFSGIPQSALRCAARAIDSNSIGNFEFYIFPEGANTRVQFRLLANQVVFSKKTILIPKKYPLELELGEDFFGFHRLTESNFEGGDNVGVVLKNKKDSNGAATLKQISFSNSDQELSTGLIDFNCRPVDFELPKAPKIDSYE